MKPDFQLIIGGAWSGKTARAEFLARSYRQVAWIGTSSRGLPELESRISELQSARPNHWIQVDSPLNLISTLQEVRKKYPDSMIVIDSFSQWISNEMASKSNRYDEQQLLELCRREADDFFSEIEATAKSNSILVVSADFGQSLAPQDSAQRIIRMCVGMTNAKLGSISTSAELIQAGFVIFKNQR